MKPAPGSPYRKTRTTVDLHGRWPLAQSTGWKEVKPLAGVYDIAATPGAKEHEVSVYVARGDRIENHIYTGGSAGDSGQKLRLSDEFKFPVPAGRTVGAVCAVYQPESFPDEDPDTLRDVDRVVYGGCDVVDRHAIAGEYECHLYDGKDKQNKGEWHHVTVTRVNDTTFRWANMAGAGWTLTATADKSKLKVGDGCPYKEHHEVTIEWKNKKVGGEIAGLRGPHGELYEKLAAYREIRACFSSDQPAKPGTPRVPVEGTFFPPFFKLPPDGMKRGGMHGMRVDSRYLWVFNQLHIACTTHTSVKQALLHQIAAPSWIVYDVPKELHAEFYRSSDPYSRVHGGLVDLAPCDDGSLVAVVSNLRNGANGIYHLTPRIDRAKKTMIVEGKERNNDGVLIKTNGWVQEKDKWAHRVLKQPIFCWNMLEDLIATLEKATAEDEATASKSQKRVSALVPA